MGIIQFIRQILSDKKEASSQINKTNYPAPYDEKMMAQLNRQVRKADRFDKYREKAKKILIKYGLVKPNKTYIALSKGKKAKCPDCGALKWIFDDEKKEYICAENGLVISKYPWLSKPKVKEILKNRYSKKKLEKIIKKNY